MEQYARFRKLTCIKLWQFSKTESFMNTLNASTISGIPSDFTILELFREKRATATRKTILGPS